MNNVKNVNFLKPKIGEKVYCYLRERNEIFNSEIYEINSDKSINVFCYWSEGCSSLISNLKHKTEISGNCDYWFRENNYISKNKISSFEKRYGGQILDDLNDDFKKVIFDKKYENLTCAEVHGVILYFADTYMKFWKREIGPEDI